MWRLAVSLVVLSFVVESSNGASTGVEVENDWTGYKVLRTIPRTPRQLTFLSRLVEADSGLDFWKEPAKLGEPVDILASPEEQEHIREPFDSIGLELEEFVPDVAEAIRGENPPQYKSAAGQFSFHGYHRFDSILAHMDSLPQSRPTSYGPRAHVHVDSINIGTSTHGRRLSVVHLSTSPLQSKPAIWMDCGIHAREWISPATCMYMIDKLLSSAHKGDTANPLSDWDFYILPVANPDGYEYSHTNNRMWRKTRSTANRLSSFLSAFNRRCTGVDPNRNFGFHWMEGGASSRPCSDIFAGNRAFSEPETRAIRDFLRKDGIRGRVKAYLTVHSYSQYFLTPWGYSRQRPDDYAELEKMAYIFTGALQQVNGRQYKVGSSGRDFYIASGGSDDWAKAPYHEGGADIKYSYTIELPDTGTHGFILPAHYIEPVGKETWAGLQAFSQALYGKIYRKNIETQINNIIDKAEEAGTLEQVASQESQEEQDSVEVEKSSMEVETPMKEDMSEEEPVVEPEPDNDENTSTATDDETQDNESPPPESQESVEEMNKKSSDEIEKHLTDVERPTTVEERIEAVKAAVRQSIALDTIQDSSDLAEGLSASGYEPGKSPSMSILTLYPLVSQRAGDDIEEIKPVSQNQEMFETAIAQSYEYVEKAEIDHATGKPARISLVMDIDPAMQDPMVVPDGEDFERVVYRDLDLTVKLRISVPYVRRRVGVPSVKNPLNAGNVELDVELM